MRSPTNYARGSVGFNMTPMIDVVFLLSIFFLVASHLSQQEAQLEELDLPGAGTGQRADEDEIRRVVVNVLPQEQPGGRVKVAGRVMSCDELGRLIDYESRRAGRQLEVRIRSDRRVPYRIVEPIMVACARNGVWKVTFAVVQQ